MPNKMNRRNFVSRTAISSAGVLVGGTLAGSAIDKDSGITSYNIMHDVMKYRKIDAHEHVDLHHGGADPVCI